MFTKRCICVDVCCIIYGPLLEMGEREFVGNEGASGSVRASSASPNIRPLTTEWWFYDQRGSVIRHMDRREYLEYFIYDKVDNLIEYKDENGNATRYTYDKVGNIKEVREPNGALTKYDSNSLFF